MSSERTELCAEVEESLADILDGFAPARLIDHLAECDQCRDKRHEAEQVAEALEHAGADFRAPDGFADKMIAAVMAARPNEPAATPIIRQSGEVERLAAQVTNDPQSGPVSRANPVVATAPTELAPSALADRLERTSPSASDESKTVFEPSGEVDVNRTTFDPQPLGLAMEAEVLGPNKTVVLKPGSMREMRTGSPASQERSSEDAPIVEAVTGKNDTGPSGEVRPIGRTDDRPRRAGVTVEAAPVAAGPTVDGDDDTSASEADRRETKSASKKLEVKPAKTTSGGTVVQLFRKPKFVGALALGMIAAGVGGFLLFGKKTWKQPEPTAFVDGAWSGKVEGITRAAADGQSGVEVCTGDKGDKCTAGWKGGAIEPGSIVRTDARTRVRLSLVDGTVLSLDRNSEVSLAGGTSRQAKVERGMVVADIAKADKAVPAKFVLPQGEVEVVDAKLDAKLSITTTERRSAIEVARSEVKVTSQTGEASSVRAGEEANLTGQGAATVGSKHTMSDMLEWSDQSQEDVDGALKGIGELKAKKPGDQNEKAHAVRLAKHDVKIRVVDVVARTEVDETFTNDTDEVLEGIYRFPLPPDAQIEKLSLEVDGKLIDGAFVDRDKGAAIWRGAIQQAAPQQKFKEEVIWVPGPWRDPALLEWQRGGRFELHIFPIPAHGSRRVVLTYTQTVQQSGGIRRFAYPLGLDGTGATKIDDFGIDLQVLGLDKDFGVSTRGYQLASANAPADGQRFTLNEKSFIPAGDLTVEYALPNRDKEMTAWAYQMTPDTSVAPPQGSTPANNAPASLPFTGKPKTKAEREAQAKADAKAISDDTSPFVAISLRPNLPRWGEGHERMHVIVVDSSRSMIGERFSRATRLAASMVREMDRRDSFMLLACDTTCQGLGAAAGQPLPQVREPSPESADEVERFLGSIEPDGGSNLFTAVQAARTAAGRHDGKDLRVIYLGDGTPTVGPTKPSTVEASVRQAMGTEGSLVTVALGSDADTTTLSAMARGGAGVLVPYVPGQRVSAASIDVLAAAYGSVLSDVRVDLPAGLTQITPTEMDSIPAGGEAFVFARMNGSAIHGNVVVHGRVHGDTFEQTYPADIVASTSAGNAFVPRLFAAEKISDLERGGRVEDKDSIIALSQRFAVASRFTSLLVLESEAMFKAFGLDRSSVQTGFSGESGASSSSTEALGKGDNSASGHGRQIDSDDPAKEGIAEGEREEKSADRPDDFKGDGFGMGGSAGPAPTTASKPAQAAPPQGSAPAPDTADFAKKVPAEDPFGPGWNQRRTQPPSPRPQPNMIPMRRVFDRKATFTSGNLLAKDLEATLSDAEAALKNTPDSRDKTVALYRALMATGRIGEASDLAARWSQRDALDPDALIARADIAAMNGNREKALRILSGLADIRPGDKDIQKRLATAFTAMGAPNLACQHRIALADLDPNDVNAMAGAALCTQNLGFSTVSTALLDEVDSATRDRVNTTMRTIKLDAPALLGDVRIDVKWNNTQADLDVALIDKSGRRVSALGSPLKNVSMACSSTTSTTGETCAVAGLGSGNFVLELARSTTSNDPVSGTIVLTLPGGDVRNLPFTVTGGRTEVGTVGVFFTSRLVPIDQFGGGGGWRGRATF